MRRERDEPSGEPFASHSLTTVQNVVCSISYVRLGNRAQIFSCTGAPSYTLVRFRAWSTIKTYASSTDGLPCRIWSLLVTWYEHRESAEKLDPRVPFKDTQGHRKWRCDRVPMTSLYVVIRSDGSLSHTASAIIIDYNRRHVEKKHAHFSYSCIYPPSWGCLGHTTVHQ